MIFLIELMNDVHHSNPVAETARLVRSVGSRSIMGTRKGERRRRRRRGFIDCL